MKSNKEDLEFIEAILYSKRGFITKFNAGDNAIVLFSGGLDSTAGTIIAMEEYELNVFPLFINRGQRNLKFELKAVKFFEKFLLKKYPEQFNKVMQVNAENPPKKFKKNYPKDPKNGYPMRNSNLENIAVQYAMSLESLEKKARIILISSSPDDSFTHNQMSALRSQTMNTCVHTDDWEWQITSVLKDPCLNKSFSKKEILKWAAEKKIPIDQTRSCVKNTEKPCGNCVACISRIKAEKEFKK